MLQILNRTILILLLSLAVMQGHAQKIESWKLADLKASIEKAQKPTIINFWATFCKPCIVEIPYFEKLAAEYKASGVELILVSLDAKELYPKKLQAFLTKRKIRARVVFLDESNADLFCPAVDEKWSGAIPATLFVNNAKGYRKFFEDSLKEKELEAEIKKML